MRLEEITVIAAPVERCFDLARSVEVHLAGNVHWGESAVALEGVTSGLLGLTQRVTWRARHFGLRHKLASEITRFERPTYFRDTMVKGPFRWMQHDHYFRALEGGGTEMRDVFTFAAPVAGIGRVVEILVLRRYMSELLRERNAAIRRIAESEEWKCYVE